MDENRKFELNWLEDYQYQIDVNGDKLEAKRNMRWDSKLDLLLRRGAGFTHFRHFELKQPHHFFITPFDYAGFLISYISDTK